MDFELKKQDESWASKFRDSCRAQAEQPGFFWAAQRAKVHSRIVVGRRLGSLRIALASTAALCVVASTLLLGGHPTPSAPSTTPTIRTISDQELLAAIDETISNSTPDALAPMDLISQDIDRSLQAHNKKEAR
jgi:hypothetical protein